MTKRELLYDDIVYMRDVEGLTWKAIGERIGLSLKTANDYYHDPTGARARARKAKEIRECVDCGAPCNTDGSVANPSVRCLPCAAKHSGAERKVWTREACIQAMRDWADEHNGVYPTVIAWSPTHARDLGGRAHPDYLREPERWPCFHTVLRNCGTWREAVVAAGFTPRKRGQTLASLRVAA